MVAANEHLPRKRLQILQQLKGLRALVKTVAADDQPVLLVALIKAGGIQRLLKLGEEAVNIACNK